ncbi:Uncharacterised protein [uncultured archaeon]|nr:Uncharacterised protein [uncultured archaeon]
MLFELIFCFHLPDLQVLKPGLVLRGFSLGLEPISLLQPDFVRCCFMHALSSMTF